MSWRDPLANSRPGCLYGVVMRVKLVLRFPPHASQACRIDTEDSNFHLCQHTHLLVGIGWLHYKSKLGFVNVAPCPPRLRMMPLRLAPCRRSGLLLTNRQIGLAIAYVCHASICAGAVG
jgi:hypothetical protein